MTASARYPFRQFFTIALLAITLAGLGHTAHAQVASDDIITNGNWWRNCASLDLDFYNDQYYINSNTSCDGTTGTVYSGAAYGTNLTNFITGVGATFTRAGTNITSTAAPFYLTSPQTFVSRASVTNNVTSSFAPFYTNATQAWVSRADTAAVATYFDSTGTLQTVAKGVARSATYSYNGGSWVANAGTLIEPAATNSIRNNTMAGAAAGSPGTLPTDWTFSNYGGVAYSVVGTGTESGINYVDIAFSGTASGSFYINFETAVAAIVGQTWTSSAYIKLTSGSLANVTTANLRVQQNAPTGSSAYIQNTNISSLGSGSLSTARYSVSLTAPISASQSVSTLIYFIGNGSLNFTLRIGMPQLEQSSYATSVIATSGSAVTRSADVYNQQPASYFDSTGTLNFAAANTARTNYIYNGSSWVNSGTLIEPASTNAIHNNMMVGAVVADGAERSNNGTFSNTSPNVCSGSTTSSTNNFSCSTGSAVAAKTISSISYSTTTATVTTGTTAHGLAVGNVVTVSGALPTTYNGTYVVTAVTTYTFSYTMASSPGSNATTVGSYTATTGGWASTLNTGTGTITASTGSMSLTGDGTNAASVYEEIPTVYGYYYTVAVTTGAGNAATVQVGTTLGSSNLMAATNVAASGTTNVEFQASGAVSYVQVNNASATAAVITTVSVQSDGFLPTTWTFPGGGIIPPAITAKVVGTGTESGIAYVDINFVATSSSSINVYMDSLIATAAAQGQIWDESCYVKLSGGSMTNVSTAKIYFAERNSSGTALASFSQSFTPTSAGLSTQRINISGTLPDATAAYVGPTMSVSFSGAANLTLRIGMPQLEQTSYATSPIPTFGNAVTRTADVYNQPVGTYYNSSGILTTAAANTPRLDHNPVSPYNPLGILIEGTFTNLLPYSVPDGGTNWTYIASNTVGTANVATAPDNTTSAASIADNGTSASHYATPTAPVSFTSGIGYAFSIFAKASTATVLQLALPSAEFGSTIYADFNLSAGTVSSTGSGATAHIQALNNGWYRCSITSSSSGASASGSDYPIIALTNNSTTATGQPSYTGTGKVLYIWGAQLEQGLQNSTLYQAFATSYIPTSGSTMTRATDVFTIPTTAGGGWYNSAANQGTLISGGIAPNVTIYPGFAELNNNTSGNVLGNFMGPLSQTTTTTGGRAQIVVNGTTVYSNTSSPAYTLGTPVRAVIAFQANNVNAAQAGTLLGLSTSVSLPTMTQLFIGGIRNGGSASGYILDGWVNRITYFPIRQPDSSLPDFSR